MPSPYMGQDVGAPSLMGRRCAPYKCFGPMAQNLGPGQFICPGQNGNRGPRRSVLRWGLPHPRTVGNADF